MDEILEAQIVGNKNYVLDYTRGETNNMKMPKTSSISIAMKNIKVKVIKQGNMHKKFGFAKHVQSTSAVSTSKLALQLSFMKDTYAEKVKG